MSNTITVKSISKPMMLCILKGIIEDMETDESWIEYSIQFTKHFDEDIYA